MRQRRNVTGYAIDGLDSKDLDDAILLASDENGYTVTVSISDVASGVAKGSDIDQRAFDRAFTRYFARGNNPMLPRRLAEHSLSLLPRQKRDVVIFEIRLNSKLEIIGVEVGLGHFSSHRRFTHKQVDTILGNEGHGQHQMWTAYYKFAEKLLNKRRRAGALVVYDLKLGLYANEEGVVIRKQPGEYFRPYVIVQEFMILVNHAATVYLASQGVQLLYRNHAMLVNDTNKEEILHQLYGSTEKLTADVLADLNERVRALVGRARYEAGCKGHFGLNLTAYAHWTSPIRRYADLANHRQLVAWLSGQTPAYTIDELRQIGEHLNAVADEVKAIAAGAYKAETQKGIKEAGKDELLKLESGHFSYFVRMLTEEGMPLTKQRFDVITQKIQERTLPLVDYVRILFTEVPDEVLWRRLQENALQALVVNPDNVRMVLGLAQQTMGWEPTIRHTQVGEGRFSATATITRGQRFYESQPCEGHGKGEAEVLAITELLRIITHINIELPKGAKMTATANPGNPKGLLLEVCMQRGWPYPTFSSTQQGPSNQPLFTCTAELKRPNHDTVETEPCKATTKKQAEQMASRSLLALLNIKERGGNGPSDASSNGVAKAVGTDWRANPISALQEFCQKHGTALPSYDDEQSGRAHTPNFKVRCRILIGGSEEVFEAEGSNKKEAKKNAASKACERIFATAA